MPLSSRDIQSRFPSLTAREADIVAAIAAGMANETIATTLGITERTVKNTLVSVPFKVGLGDDRGGSVRVRIALRAHGLL
jgi:DNA-binding NarL/FixJ family response regulator